MYLISKSLNKNEIHTKQISYDYISPREEFDWNAALLRTTKVKFPWLYKYGGIIA